MSFLNTLKKVASPFVDIADDQQAEQPATPSPATPTTTSLATPVSARSVSGTVVDEDLRAKITADVDAATPPDLNDFNDLVKSFAELPMDAATKFKSAFVAFQKQSKKGVDALLKGMLTRKQALDNAIATFESELQAAQTEIDGKRSQAEKLQQEMTKLSEKIVDLKAQQSQLLMNASQEEQDLSSQKATFMATADAVLAELNQQEQQLQMYLAPTMPASAKVRSKR